jgi:hypothetical protein
MRFNACANPACEYVERARGVTDEPAILLNGLVRSNATMSAYALRCRQRRAAATSSPVPTSRTDAGSGTGSGEAKS